MESPGGYAGHSRSQTGNKPMRLHDRCTMHEKRAKKGQMCVTTTDLKSSTYDVRRTGLEPVTS